MTNKTARPKTDEAGLAAVLAIISKNKLAEGLGIKKQNLTRWKKVPVNHVNKVSELTGIPRETILPSVFT